MDDHVGLRGPVTRDAIATVRRMKRWRVRDWAVYSPLVVGSVALVYLCGTSPPPDISRGAYDRIQQGMTEWEVDDIVGARPGGYELFIAPGDRLERNWGTPERWASWGNRDGILTVAFDAEGRVCGKGLEHHPSAEGVLQSPAPRGWWARLVRRAVPDRQTRSVYLGPF
jgi:hypothetical protein